MLENAVKSMILIVDDNKKNLQVLGNILHEEHYKVAVSMNGSTAIKLAHQLHPDIIILDIMMPEMNGFEVCTLLKKEDDTREIPIIFLTAKVESEDVVEGFNLGGVDYITKPFKKKELLVRLKNHLDLQASKRKIEDQAKELAEINGFKDKLFSIIGHDLRSPLSSLKLTLDLIVGGLISFKDDDFIGTIENLSKSTDEAFVLLENLLGWAKSQSGTIVVIPETLNLKELTESVQRLLKLNLKNKSINFSIEIDENHKAFADNQMTKTVLRNLISNAIKFTPNKGSITLTSEIEDDKVKIVVKDSGVGISAENISKLFNAQTTVKTYGTNNEAGSGLGLILCKDFVERNGGLLHVESEEGKGSSFIFTLPLTTDL